MPVCSSHSTSVGGWPTGSHREFGLRCGCLPRGRRWPQVCTPAGSGFYCNPYRCVGWSNDTSRNQLRAGPIDVSVLVQDCKSGEAILDATVDLALEPLDSDSPRLRARATHEQATNKLLQAAVLNIPAVGRWGLRAVARRGPEEATVVTGFQVAPPAPRLAAIWPYVLLPPFVIAVFALHQALRRTRFTACPPLRPDGWT